MFLSSEFKIMELNVSKKSTEALRIVSFKITLFGKRIIKRISLL